MKLSRTALTRPVLERPETIDTLELGHLRAVAHGLVDLLVKKAERPKRPRKLKPPPVRVLGPVVFPHVARLLGTRLVSLNRIELPMARSGRVKREKLAVRRALGICPATLPPQLDVIITRYAPGYLDTDNLAASAKSIRDAVAWWLGLDDGRDERTGAVTWHVEQAKTKPGVYHVDIRIEARP